MKHIRHLLSAAAVLLAGMQSTFSQPSNLTIAPTGNQMILYWPTTFQTNLILQSTTNGSGSNWMTVTDSVPVVAVVVPNDATQKYFRLYNPLANFLNGMVYVPAGAFQFGDNLDEDRADSTPAVTATISGFYIDTNLVSYSLWESIYTNATNLGYTFDDIGWGKATNHPVYGLNWYDCVKWCNARSVNDGFTPCYYMDAGFTTPYTNGQNDGVFVNWAANGYRLPTEAEFEKAGRGGVNGQRFPLGNTISEYQANYASYPNYYSYDLGPAGYNGIYGVNPQPYTSPVGVFPANGFGINDMEGNLLEWCYDWYYPANYSTTYGSSNLTDPTGAISGDHRVLRGGCWQQDASSVRFARRWLLVPYTGGQSDANVIGFRTVRRP